MKASLQLIRSSQIHTTFNIQFSICYKILDPYLLRERNYISAKFLSMVGFLVCNLYIVTNDYFENQTCLFSNHAPIERFQECSLHEMCGILFFIYMVNYNVENQCFYNPHNLTFLKLDDLRSHLIRLTNPKFTDQLLTEVLTLCKKLKGEAYESIHK